MKVIKMANSYYELIQKEMRKVACICEELSQEDFDEFDELGWEASRVQFFAKDIQNGAYLWEATQETLLRDYFKVLKEFKIITKNENRVF